MTTLESGATRVLLVEDEPMVRGLLQELLVSRGFAVTVASDAPSARELAGEIKPHVLVVDIQLGSGPTGIDLAHAVNAASKLRGIVFLTNLPQPRLIGYDSKSIPKGAAYLSKSRLTNSDVLIQAIAATLSGFVGKEFRDDLGARSSIPELSRAQIDVLRMVATGLSNHEIAQRRNTGIRAVENLLHRAYESMGIDTDTASTNVRVNAAISYLETLGMMRG